MQAMKENRQICTRVEWIKLHAMGA